MAQCFVGSLRGAAAGGDPHNFLTLSCKCYPSQVLRECLSPEYFRHFRISDEENKVLYHNLNIYISRFTSVVVVGFGSEKTVLGRSRKSVHVVLDLPNNTISRKHAEIVRTKSGGDDADDYTIRDLVSPSA